MTFLKSKKRFGQFETLETKKLFAADLAASADVLSLDPGNCVSALTAGVVDPDDGCPLRGTVTVNLVNVKDSYPQLGGQEGEPVSGPATEIVLANLGGQEGEDVADRDTENFRSILPKSGPGSHSGDSWTCTVVDDA